MSLTSTRQSDKVAICRELCRAGEYRLAAVALGRDWPGLGNVSDSNDPELLLVIGTVATELGAIEQALGAQEAARDMLSRSVRIFEEQGDPQRAESMVQEGFTYWRSNQHDEAMVIVNDVLNSFSDDEPRMHAFITRAIFETEVGSFADAIATLKEAEPLAESVRPFLRGKFHNQRGMALRALAKSDEELLDRAIIEYEAAAVYFEEAGNRNNDACVSNNLAGLLADASEFERAHYYVDRAGVILKDDKAKYAQNRDQKAKIYLAENQPHDALQYAREAVSLLMTGEQRKWLQDCLATQRKAIKSLKAIEKARKDSEKETREANEIAETKAALIAADGVTTKAADILGITQPALAKRVKRFPELASLRKPTRVRRWRKAPK